MTIRQENIDMRLQENNCISELIELTKDYDGYPQRVTTILQDKAPKKLNVIGNLSLLEKSSIGISGSRDAFEISLSVARDCARQAAENGMVVVSGNARGVDLAAHYSCLKNGGDTILVLAEGLHQFRVRKELKSVWNWQKVLVISQFANDARWHFYKAKERNELIVALSRALVVIQAGEKGGTLEAGKQAIKKNVPVYAVQYENQEIAKGNQILFDRKKSVGRIKLSGDTNKANLERVFAVARNDEIMRQLL